MLKSVMEEALNKQVNEELFSAYLYASMVGYFESANLKGFAHWMRMQVQEEQLHAQKMGEYIIARNGRLKLMAVAEPQQEWPSALAAFEAALAHEQHITGCLDALTSKSIAEQDHATRTFLEWFVTEQIEEEANADNMVQQLRLAEGAPGALFLIDREAAQRPAPTIAAPSQA